MSSEKTKWFTQWSFISPLFTSKSLYSHTFPLFFLLRKMWFSSKNQTSYSLLLIPFLPPDPCFMFNPWPHFALSVSSSHGELYEMHSSGALVKIHFQFVTEDLLETDPRTLSKFTFYFSCMNVSGSSCMSINLFPFLFGPELNIFQPSLQLDRAMWFISSHWNMGRSDVNQFKARRASQEILHTPSLSFPQQRWSLYVEDGSHARWKEPASPDDLVVQSFPTTTPQHWLVWMWYRWINFSCFKAMMVWD